MSPKNFKQLFKCTEIAISTKELTRLVEIDFSVLQKKKQQMYPSTVQLKSNGTVVLGTGNILFVHACVCLTFRARTPRLEGHRN